MSLMVHAKVKQFLRVTALLLNGILYLMLLQQQHYFFHINVSNNFTIGLCINVCFKNQTYNIRAYNKLTFYTSVSLVFLLKLQGFFATRSQNNRYIEFDDCYGIVSLALYTLNRVILDSSIIIGSNNIIFTNRILDLTLLLFVNQPNNNHDTR